MQAKWGESPRSLQDATLNKFLVDRFSGGVSRKLDKSMGSTALVPRSTPYKALPAPRHLCIIYSPSNTFWTSKPQQRAIIASGNENPGSCSPHDHVIHFDARITGCLHCENHHKGKMVSNTCTHNKYTLCSSNCSRGFGNRFDEQRLTLRIHRGRGSSGKRHHGSPHSNGSNSTTTTTGSVSPSPSTRGRHERVKISVSYPSSDNLSPPPNPHLLAVAPSSPTTQASYAVHYSVNGKDATSTSLYRRENQLRVQRLNSRRRASSRRSSSCDSVERAPSPSPSSCDDGHKPKVMSRRMGKRNIKAQVKRFRMETKAAKTLAIIVGGFIFCWLPFFTMYVVRAFCPDCIHPLVFSILFWLGYCNSAINPLIYALFSKDFRFAFKRIICKCFCKRRDPAGRRGSDGSQLQGRQFRSPSYNVQQHELGDDSDPGADPSDSR
ncbi:hypothetical protein MTP99_016558 [Tenebrio molitor]|nr:hypothetical protein MTP99_016558 [Tenebrio molitor]